jgi:hypothetical protein
VSPQQGARASSSLLPERNMKRSRHALEEKLQLSLYVLNWENIKFKVRRTDRQTETAPHTLQTEKSLNLQSLWPVPVSSLPRSPLRRSLVWITLCSGQMFARRKELDHRVCCVIILQHRRYQSRVWAALFCQYHWKGLRDIKYHARCQKGTKTCNLC